MECRIRASVMTVTVLMAIVRGSTELRQYDIIEGTNSTLKRKILLLHALQFYFIFFMISLRGSSIIVHVR